MDNFICGKIIDSLPDSVVVLDKNLRFSYINEKGRSLLCRGDVCTVNHDFFRELLPEMEFSRLEKLFFSLQSGFSAMEQTTGEINSRQYSIILKRLSDEQGGFDGIYAVMEDISPQLAISKNFKTLQNGILFSLRNNVASLLSWIDIADEFLTETGEPSILKTLNRDGKTLRFLVDNLSLLNEVLSDKNLMEKSEKLELEYLLRQALSHGEKLFDKAVFDVSTEPVEITVNKEMIISSIENILYWFAHSGKQGLIRITGSETDGVYKMIVFHPELYLSPQQQEDFFTVSYSLFGEVRNTGLYLSKMIFEKHEWNVWIESCQGKGTRVILEFDANRNK